MKLDIPQKLKENLAPLLLVCFFFAMLALALPKLVLFFAALLITAAVNWIETKYKLVFELSPVFFFSILITRYLNLNYTLAFILLGGALPTILAGRGSEVHRFLFWIEIFILNIFSVGLTANIAGAGIVMSVLQFIVSTGWQVLLGMLAGQVLLRTATLLAANIFYFLLFWNLWLQFRV